MLLLTQLPKGCMNDQFGRYGPQDSSKESPIRFKHNYTSTDLKNTTKLKLRMVPTLKGSHKGVYGFIYL